MRGGLRVPPGEQGFAAVAVVALSALVVTVGLAAAAMAAIVAAHRAAQSAADLAALGAAQAVQRGADACAVAERIATANQAALTGCQVEGGVVAIVVEVAVPILRRVLPARARAGPG